MSEDGDKQDSGHKTQKKGQKFDASRLITRI